MRMTYALMIHIQAEHSNNNKHGWGKHEKTQDENICLKETKTEHNTPTTASKAGTKTKTDMYIYNRAQHSNNWKQIINTPAN